MRFWVIFGLLIMCIDLDCIEIKGRYLTNVPMRAKTMEVVGAEGVPLIFCCVRSRRHPMASIILLGFWSAMSEGGGLNERAGRQLLAIQILIQGAVLVSSHFPDLEVDGGAPVGT